MQRAAKFGAACTRSPKSTIFLTLAGGDLFARDNVSRISILYQFLQAIKRILLVDLGA